MLLTKSHQLYLVGDLFIYVYYMYFGGFYLFFLNVFTFFLLTIILIFCTDSFFYSSSLLSAS